MNNQFMRLFIYIVLTLIPLAGSTQSVKQAQVNELQGQWLNTNQHCFYCSLYFDSLKNYVVVDTRVDTILRFSYYFKGDTLFFDDGKKAIKNIFTTYIKDQAIYFSNFMEKGNAEFARIYRKEKVVNWH